MGRNTTFIDGIMDELSAVMPDDMEALKLRLGLTTTDMCQILGIHYTSYQRKFIHLTTPLNNTDKLFILFSNIHMVRPMDYLAIRRSERSYWLAWRDMGAFIPEDVLPSYTIEISNQFIDIEFYRKGVEDITAARLKQEMGKVTNGIQSSHN